MSGKVSVENLSCAVCPACGWRGLYPPIAGIPV